MKKLIILLILLVSHQILFSQNEKIPKKITQKGFAKIDFLSIDMPITNIPNEPNMGFTGIHYNLLLNDWGYAGVGIYGSVTGKRGGFFTLGVNAGIKKYFSKDFYLDTGFHFGGGGGAGAPDGGGAFILPHFNLGYNFESFSINYNLVYEFRADNNKVISKMRTHAISMRGSLQLTENWSIGIGNVGYNFVRKKIEYTRVTFSRKLHCWNMNFSWTPNRNTYSFFIGVNSSNLSFLKYNYGQNNFDGLGSSFR